MEIGKLTCRKLMENSILSNFWELAMSNRYYHENKCLSSLKSGSVLQNVTNTVIFHFLASGIHKSYLDALTAMKE